MSEDNEDVFRPETEVDYDAGHHLSDIVALENARIESQNISYEVNLKAIEVADRSDERQFEYHSKKLAIASETADKNRNVASKFGWAIFGLMSLVVLVVTYMMFLGDESQRQAAQTAIQLILSMFGGAGALVILRSLFGKSLQSQ